MSERSMSDLLQAAARHVESAAQSLTGDPDFFKDEALAARIMASAVQAAARHDPDLLDRVLVRERDVNRRSDEAFRMFAKTR